MYNPRAISRISARALLHNLKQIRKASEGRGIVAMVKADAYGHGAVWTARLFASQPGLAAFGVATLSEGVELREALRDRKNAPPIIVFSGATPWGRGEQGNELGRLCEMHRLIPVITSIEDWRAFHAGTAKKSWSMRLPFELKFNTGMNRMGIGLEDLQEVRRGLLELSQVGVYPQGVLSHLAVGEDAGHPCSRTQRARFEALCSELAPILPDSVDFHLANSAASLGDKSWKLAGFTHRVRPGLALYGVPPASGRNTHGLKLALTLEARVILLRDLTEGETVGYGARYRVTGRERVAVLGIGYAEGIHRLWSAPDSKARVLLAGKLEPFRGPISMDLCSVRASRAVKRGDWARFWGEGIDPWKQAAAAGTIPYEVLTSITRRVERIHDPI